MRKGRLISLLLCLLMVSSISVMAFADSVPQTGSLKVSILETGTKKGIQNATVNIYLVAAVNEDSHVFTPDFAGSGFDLNTLGDLSATQNKTEAAKLVTYTTQQKIPALASQTTNASGVVNFAGLEQGLYLVRESSSPTGHAPISPFLITIPQYLDEETPIYNVDAAPKTTTSDVIPTPTPTATPVPTSNPGKLPQTGQLWWPVFVLVGLGFGLCVLGVALKQEKDS